MRAQVLTGHGGPERLEYHIDWPVPDPAPSEVLIEVSACGVNNTDINTRVGWYQGGAWGSPLRFPRIQGADPVGRIVEVGSDVTSDRIGERVLVDPWLRGVGLDGARYLGSEVDGGFAEYVAVPAANVHPIESASTDVELATIACSYSTAEHMLERAGAEEGQWVLVTGASGGVGSALVRLAKRRGARVVALTSAHKKEAVVGLGADIVLDRGRSDLPAVIRDETDGVAVFADVVGGPRLGPLLETLRPGGQYVVSGAVAGALVELDLRTLYLRDLTFHGATVVPAAVFENLIGYVRSGEVRPEVDRVFPLEQLHDAQEYFQDPDRIGSVVVEIGGQ